MYQTLTLTDTDAYTQLPNTYQFPQSHIRFQETKTIVCHNQIGYRKIYDCMSDTREQFVLKIIYAYP